MKTDTPSPSLPLDAGKKASPETMGEMVLDAAARHRGVALECRQDGATISVSYAELGSKVSQIAAGLIAIGVRPGDRVAIFAETSPHWTLADFGSSAPAPWSYRLPHELG